MIVKGKFDNENEKEGRLFNMELSLDQIDELNLEIGFVRAVMAQD